jgi:hypothetical protein
VVVVNDTVPASVAVAASTSLPLSLAVSLSEPVISLPPSLSPLLVLQHAYPRTDPCEAVRSGARQ